MISNNVQNSRPFPSSWVLVSPSSTDREFIHTLTWERAYRSFLINGKLLSMYTHIKTSTLKFWYYYFPPIASRCSSTIGYVRHEAVIADICPEEIEGTYTSVHIRVSNFVSKTSRTWCFLLYKTTFQFVECIITETVIAYYLSMATMYKNGQLEALSAGTIATDDNYHFCHWNFNRTYPCWTRCILAQSTDGHISEP